MTFKTLLFCTVACLVVGLSASADPVSVEVILKPAHTGVPVPLSADISKWPELSGKTWCLEDSKSGSIIPCQINKGELLFVIEVPVSDVPVKRLLQLKPSNASPDKDVRIEHTESKRLKIVDGDQPVLEYIYRSMLPEGIPENRRRSTYIHPIYGMDGQVLTDDFPADHHHHRGLSWMWTHVKADDKDYDLWTIRGIRQHFVKLLPCESGSASANLQIANKWCTDDGMRVLDETVYIQAFRAGSKGRIVDITLVFKAVSEPVTINSSERGYGGFNLRFAPRRDTLITTSIGKIAKDVDRERYHWSDLSAKFGDSDAFSGIAIFDHPENPSYPTGWTLRPYGILNPSFTGIEPVTIQPDKPLVLQYRLWIHKGDAESGAVARVYETFMHPPVVRVKGDK